MNDNTIRILVVDDDDKVLTNLGRLFDGYPNIEATFVKTGEEAVTLLLNKSFDLAILDLGLPGISGRQVLEEVREGGFDKPIIILTVTGDPAVMADNIGGGADIYLAKPYNHKVLMAYIFRSVSKTNETTSPIIKFDKYTLDTANRKINTNDGMSFDLTATFSNILEVFLRSRLRYIPLSKIKREVWGDETATEDSSVRRCIQRLNQCFRENNQEEIIRHVYGTDNYELIRR